MQTIYDAQEKAEGQHAYGHMLMHSRTLLMGLVANKQLGEFLGTRTNLPLYARKILVDFQTW